MIGYLACLVAWRVCRQVLISYLPVGHTHEDIGTRTYKRKIISYCVLLLFLLLTKREKGQTGGKVVVATKE